MATAGKQSTNDHPPPLWSCATYCQCAWPDGLSDSASVVPTALADVAGEQGRLLWRELSILDDCDPIDVTEPVSPTLIAFTGY